MCDSTTVSLNELKDKIKRNDFTSIDFKTCWGEIEKIFDEFKSLLGYAADIRKDDKELQHLLKNIGLSKASNLMQSLRNTGFALQKDLGEAFSKSAYRLLEQIRACKRSEVMYGITRIFISYQTKIPDIVNEAFKPYYDDEMFKCFMFTFLSSIIKPKENKSTEE
jgi:hypothetical protein